MNLKLDYSLDANGRRDLVNKILEETPSSAQTPRFLESLSDYLIFSSLDKTDKKNKQILTDNRLITINRHETSYQGLAETLESGEDGIYNLTNDGNRRDYIISRVKITEDDIKRNPALQQLQESISNIKNLYNAASGKQRYLYKKWLISLYQDQYAIKDNFRHSSQNSNPVKNNAAIALPDDIYIDESGAPRNRGILSLFNPAHIFALLSNYEALSIEAEAHPESDVSCVMRELQSLIEKVYPPNRETYPPAHRIILEEEIRGSDLKTIQARIKRELNQSHSIEYISILWHKKIPLAIAEEAIRDYLTWYYTFQERGQWKKCTRCGQIKLAHPIYFSKNASSKDGYYSICKDCRKIIYQNNKRKKVSKQ